jgi:hypothetical protein
MGDHFAGGNLQSIDECLCSVPHDARHAQVGITAHKFGARSPIVLQLFQANQGEFS